MFLSFVELILLYFLSVPCTFRLSDTNQYFIGLLQPPGCSRCRSGSCNYHHFIGHLQPDVSLFSHSTSCNCHHFIGHLQLALSNTTQCLVIAIILSATYSPSRIMELVSTGWYSSGTCETRSILSRTSPLPVISAFSFVLLPRQVLQCFRSTPPLWRLAAVSF